ncbi:MAG: membrane protein insertase YidC [Rikenellaceae bacterium]
MDKNKLIAFALIAAIFFGFSYFNAQEQEKYAAQKALVEAQNPTPSVEVAQPSPAQESVAAKSSESFGESLSTAMSAEAETITLSNDVMSVDFSTRGAYVSGVTLSDYTKFSEGERTELVEMFEREGAKMDLSFYIRRDLNNVRINTMDFVFEDAKVKKVEGGEQLSMSLNFGGEAKLEYIYTLYNGEDDARNYLLDFTIRMENMTPVLANQSALTLDWSNKSFQNERGFSNENTYTTLSYHFVEERSIEELGVGTESKSESVSTAMDWIAFKQQYFSSAIIAPEGGISTADVSYVTAKPNSGYIKSFSAKMSLPLTPTTEEYRMALYYGPNKYATLKGINDLGYGDLRMQELVPLGWGIFGWVNKWLVIPIFDLLRGHIASFGIIILILSVFVKLLISPLTYNSYISMAKMRVIKPQVDAIAERYPKQEDAMKKQQATMDLYKKTGINPMGGCIPMLIQMPIIIAMFRFFPASIELRGESFLWASDLSSYDSILTLPFEIPFYGDHVSLFALLMAVVLYFYSAMNYNQSASSQPQMAGMKFMMVYMMPVMMLLWFNSYSSGLCYYYFLANILTIFQTLMIRRMVDDEKILAILRQNEVKNKNKKKSNFQLRYEAMVAEQERQAGAKSKK